MEALLGEILRHVHEPPPGVRQAMGHDGIQVPRRVGCGGVAHLDRPAEFTLPASKHLGQVLPGVVHAREEQGHPVLACLRDEPGGVDALALLRAPGHEVGPGQHLHGGVVLVDHIPLGRPGNQFLEGRLQEARRLQGQLPLRSRREGNAQARLQLRQAVEGRACAIPEHGDHARGRLVILFLSHPFRGRSLEHLAAAVAAEAIQLHHLGREG